MFCLGKRAEKEKILIRKRAAAATKLRSKSQNEDDFDIAFEVLGRNNKREVKVGIFQETVFHSRAQLGKELRVLKPLPSPNQS